MLLPRARAVLAELATAEAELAELAGVITGRLRLGMIGSTGQAAPVVERALAAFHHRHPGVEIVITDTGSRQMAEQVRAGDLDLAFVGLFADQVPADLAHRVLADEPLVAVVPRAKRPAEPGRPRRAGGRARRSSRCGPSPGLRQQVDAAFARAGVARRVAFELARPTRGAVRRAGLRCGAGARARRPRATGRGDVG